MRAIETIITVTSEGEIIVPARADLPAGEHRAVLVIDETARHLSTGETPEALQLYTFALTNWPADATFRREDLYGDDGR